MPVVPSDHGFVNAYTRSPLASSAEARQLAQGDMRATTAMPRPASWPSAQWEYRSCLWQTVQIDAVSICSAGVDRNSKAHFASSGAHPLEPPSALGAGHPVRPSAGREPRRSARRCVAVAGAGQAPQEGEGVPQGCSRATASGRATGKAAGGGATRSARRAAGAGLLHFKPIRALRH